MATAFNRQIRERLAAYLAGETSLRDFQTWFIPRAFALDESAPPDETALAFEIELRLAEYTSGHWTEAELRRLFTSLLTPASGEATPVA